MDLSFITGFPAEQQEEILNLIDDLDLEPVAPSDTLCVISS